MTYVSAAAKCDLKQSVSSSRQWQESERHSADTVEQELRSLYFASLVVADLDVETR